MSKKMKKIPCEDCLLLVRCRLKTRYSMAPIGMLKYECPLLKEYCDKNEDYATYSNELRNILYKGNYHDLLYIIGG